MASGIPLQHECDIDDPEEMFLWMLTALPGMEEQAPMLIPPAWARKWSQRLHDAGARFHADEQTVKYIPPAQSKSFLNAGSGRWVPLEEVPTVQETAPSISGLSIAEKREVVKQLQAEGYIPAAVDGPEPDVAEVGKHGD